MTQRGRQMQARAIEKEAQRAQSHRGQNQQHQERERKQQGKPRADFGRISQRPGDAAERGYHHGCDSQLQAARPPARKPAADARRALLHKPAQHQHGTHRAHIEQRRQTEEQRGEQARCQARERRLPRESKSQMHGEQRPERCRQRHHDADTDGDAQQSAGEPEAQRLQQKDAQQIRGIRADGLENRQRVHVLLEMRVHGHGNADGAEHHARRGR